MNDKNSGGWRTIAESMQAGMMSYSCSRTISEARYFVTEHAHHYAYAYTQIMFLIGRSANRQVAFKFGNCPMRLMPFAPDNSGSIFIDNSSAKSATDAKRRFSVVFEILTFKREWDLLLASRTQQRATMMGPFNAKLGEPLAIKYTSPTSHDRRTLHWPVRRLRLIAAAPFDAYTIFEQRVSGTGCSFAVCFVIIRINFETIARYGATSEMLEVIVLLY